MTEDIFEEKSTPPPTKEVNERHKDKDEGKKQFMALLRDSKIKSTAKWQDAVSIIENDQRYRALPTKDQRIAAFQHYISEQEERTKECEVLKSGYRELLNAHLENKPDIRYRDILTLIEEDLRFIALRNFYAHNPSTEHYLPVRSKRHSGNPSPNEMMEEFFYNHVEDLSKQKKKKKQQSHGDIWMILRK